MTRRPALAARPDIADLEPYASPRRAAHYQLNTNESPYPPPAALVEAVTKRLLESSFNRYPDNDPHVLLTALAERNAWRPQGVWVANGSNEIFLYLLLAFGGPERSTLLFTPTYSLHASIPRISGTRVHESNRDEEFLVDLEDAVSAIRGHRPDIVIVCSPNNPTGGCEPVPTIAALAEEAPGLVVVDEAYIEFAEESDTAVPLLARYDNVVVVRTFSKAWSLAGVRIGYLLTDPAIVAELARVRLPYSLSSITQAMGLAALEHASETLDAVRSTVEERNRVGLELQAMGLLAYPSRANFVLFEVPDAHRVFGALLEREVLVRSYSNHPRLANCLRVTIGLTEENDAFLLALREIVGE